MRGWTSVGAAIALSAGLLALPIPARACTCAQPASPDVALEHADRVFLGTVIPVVARIVGEERLMDASAYAHFNCMCPDSVSAIASRDDLAPDLTRKLLGTNAARLFNLKV